MTDETALNLERNRLRRELDRIRDLTGQVKHSTPEECYGCGCYSLTAEEAVVYALRELRSELAAMTADRNDWKRLCQEAIKEGQRSLDLCRQWQDIAEGNE